MRNSDNEFFRIFKRLAVTFIFPTCKNTYSGYEHWLDGKAASSFLNMTCQRNLTPLHGGQIIVCLILGRKKIRYMRQNAFFPCLQGIGMRRSKREDQKTDV